MQASIHSLIGEEKRKLREIRLPQIKARRKRLSLILSFAGCSQTRFDCSLLASHFFRLKQSKQQFTQQTSCQFRKRRSVRCWFDCSTSFLSRRHKPAKPLARAFALTGRNSSCATNRKKQANWKQIELRHFQTHCACFAREICLHCAFVANTKSKGAFIAGFIFGDSQKACSCFCKIHFLTFFSFFRLHFLFCTSRRESIFVPSNKSLFAAAKAWRHNELHFPSVLDERMLKADLQCQLQISLPPNSPRECRTASSEPPNKLGARFALSLDCCATNVQPKTKTR